VAYGLFSVGITFQGRWCGMDGQRGETWQFEVNCPHAERVYLVKDYHDGKSWILMTSKGRGNWSVKTRLPPGRYRMTYFTAEGTAYFNGGSFGLTGTRLGPNDPGVTVEHMEQPQPA
jgi:hypothetical protein